MKTSPCPAINLLHPCYSFFNSLWDVWHKMIAEQAGLAMEKVNKPFLPRGFPYPESM